MGEKEMLKLRKGE